MDASFTELTGWAAIVSMLLTFSLPLVTGFVTKASWHPGVRAVVLLALTAAKTIGDAYVADHLTHTVIVTTILNFGIAVASYFGLWKPTGASTAALSTGPLKDPGQQPPTTAA